ncbi:MAG: nucleoside-diphosphate kinase [Gemmatimonadota bacterium]|nr:MAG: nucleoside-diphosphate kinase [Gemmatimonadota bacterium]
MDLTLAIIKPDAVEGRKIGRILAQLEDAGFSIRAAKFVQLDEPQAGAFYAVHSERPFYEPLKRFMTSGPILALALEHEDAVTRLRKVIGATDPAEAEPGTVRAQYAESKERNAIHASDSDETARQELSFFFSSRELMGAA